MGIKERHERDRESVRRAILDAACELFVADGYQNVSIRKIAERVEYSPAAIYSYFPSKDDIFFALAEEGFRLLHTTHNRYLDLDTLPPEARIRTLFLSLYEFSVEHPEYFALMFIDRHVPRISREYERFAFAREMKTQLIVEVQRAIDAGVFSPGVHPYIAFRILSAAVIGVSLTRLSGRLAPGENADDLIRDTLDVTVAGLRAGVTLVSKTDQCFLNEPESEAFAAPASPQELGS
ncbi:MAG: TetR/AcrR family transcriptional regulator [Acidobacteriaceae bacterium]|jgi:AcrR family transcriptional regulator|nr:TetR/AcrR family transcriptional regulator [Acidobacteriaceae bacterium]